MKKIMLMILPVMMLFLFQGCKKDEVSSSTLLITFTSHPQGGTQVATVSSGFDGIVVGNAKAIEVTAEWWWEDANHQNSMIKKTEQITFSSNNNTSKSTAYSASSGYILLNYYWVKLKWTDDSGVHTLESGKAFCQQ